MSEPTDSEREATKQRMRAALDVLQDYVDDNGKIDATKMTQDIRHWKKLATQRGARMQILRRWWCLEACDGTEFTLDDVWRDLMIGHPEAEGWFDADGVPVDE